MSARFPFCKWLNNSKTEDDKQQELTYIFTEHE